MASAVRENVPAEDTRGKLSKAAVTCSSVNAKNWGVRGV
jgi:hypothetical protein